jgi:SpoIID/LytB domain protein
MVNGRLLVVNDIDIEQYLYKVIPSEMPSSYNSEALKAQAIAARTYAYRDIYNRTYEKSGYTVDDSTMSQVYNNINEQLTTNAAVNATKGLVMMYHGELVSAFYYSTSSGLTASAHEVWIDDGFHYPAPIPYLIGRNLSKDTSGNVPQFDYRDEASMLTFFKNTSYTAPDSNISAYYRWHVTFTKAQLALTFQKNLKLMYASTPNLILTQTSAGWASLPIPADIGTVNNIYVAERGESGVVISLIADTSSGTYKIINQYNIRFTIRPKDAGVNNNSILFSGFFAIEQIGDSYTFYGGGNGHGVGMSQNGANSLGKSGYGYQQILTTYYSDIDLTNITYDYQYISDFKQYFQ